MKRLLGWVLTLLVLAGLSGCTFATTDKQGWTFTAGAPFTIGFESFGKQERPGDPQTGSSTITLDDRVMTVFGPPAPPAGPPTSTDP